MAKVGMENGLSLSRCSGILYGTVCKFQSETRDNSKLVVNVR